MAVAILDQWGEEWKQICRASGAKFKDAAAVNFEKQWQRRS